jgi:hypothetical protein
VDSRSEQIARVVHEAVRAWARANRDASIPSWGRAPRWMREATADAIAFRLANPGAPPSAMHEQWAAEKRAAGWRRGKAKDGRRKTHPRLVPYERLPAYDRRKDALVAAVIDALLGPLS